VSAEHLSNLPYLIALLTLIAAVLVLERLQPRLMIGGWAAALCLIFLSQFSWYFADISPIWHVAMHVVRLCTDLSAGFVFLLFAGRRLSDTPLRRLVAAWQLIPLLALETIYGLDIVEPTYYYACAGLGTLISVALAARSRNKRWILAIQIGAWAAIAAFSSAGNYRASAYWGLAAVYAAAAVHLWSRLPHRTVGRVAISASLSIWALTFLLHPWVLPHPLLRQVAESIWSMQKFFATFSMLVLFLETMANENQQLAMQDQLTGIANRRRMEQRLIESVAAGPTGILLLDLDGFKEINDTFGHLAGDEVLVQVASRLTGVIGPNDTFARMGGDEFIIISTGDMQALKASAITALQQPMAIEDIPDFRIRASIGLAIYPEDAGGKTGTDAVRQLLRAADSNMYAQKKDHNKNKIPPLTERRLHRGQI
jgi:diguanylate cyclase (GGDEF)-like protein